MVCFRKTEQTGSISKCEIKYIRKANKTQMTVCPQLDKAIMITFEGDTQRGSDQSSAAKVNCPAVLDFPESLSPLFLFLDNQFRPAALRLD